MSEAPRTATASYVIGFLLSVVFTVGSYYLVVNHRVSGNTLLSAIIGFAILQMLIQVFFFLHLGRGPKPAYNVVFFGATVGFILVVISGSLFIMSHLYANMAALQVTTRLAQTEGISQVGGKKTGACQEIRAHHTVIISGSTASPVHTDAKLCDNLTFIAQDKVLHDIAFGPHPNHQSYAGELDLLVRKGQNQTITLNQSGTYLFHDHLDPTLTGEFTVK